MFALKKLYVGWGLDNETGLDNEGNNLLHTSISRKEPISFIQKILPEINNLDAPNAKGQTALALACFRNEQDVVELLLDHGASVVNNSHILDNNPIFITLSNDNANILDLLLEHTDQSAAQHDMFKSALPHAIKLSRVNYFEKLLKFGTSFRDSYDAKGKHIFQDLLCFSSDPFMSLCLEYDREAFEDEKIWQNLNNSYQGDLYVHTELFPIKILMHKHNIKIPYELIPNLTAKQSKNLIANNYGHILKAIRNYYCESEEHKKICQNLENDMNFMVSNLIVGDERIKDALTQLKEILRGDQLMNIVPMMIPDEQKRSEVCLELNICSTKPQKSARKNISTFDENGNIKICEVVLPPSGEESNANHHEVTYAGESSEQ